MKIKRGINRYMIKRFLKPLELFGALMGIMLATVLLWLLDNE